MVLAQDGQQALHRLQCLLAAVIVCDSHHLIRGQAMFLA